jgi:hypothetical protein
MFMLVLLTVVEIVVLIAGLAFFLWWLGSLLNRIGANLEQCDEHVRTIVGHASAIRPGVEHINRTGGVVAGALPLLYGFAERIVANVSPRPAARRAASRRRSRLHEAVGFVVSKK